MNKIYIIKYYHNGNKKYIDIVELLNEDINKELLTIKSLLTGLIYYMYNEELDITILKEVTNNKTKKLIMTLYG